MTSTARALLVEFKDYFRTLQQSDLSQLRRMYARDVVFKDPIHEIRGLVELEDYYMMMCSQLSDCRFEYLDELVHEGAAYIKWVLHFKHSKIGSRGRSVRGVSHLQWRDKIEFHEDFFNLDAMADPQQPGFAFVSRWLRLRRAC